MAAILPWAGATCCGALRDGRAGRATAVGAAWPRPVTRPFASAQIQPARDAAWTALILFPAFSLRMAEWM